MYERHAPPDFTSRQGKLLSFFERTAMTHLFITTIVILALAFALTVNPELVPLKTATPTCLTTWEQDDDVAFDQDLQCMITPSDFKTKAAVTTRTPYSRSGTATAQVEKWAKANPTHAARATEAGCLELLFKTPTIVAVFEKEECNPDSSVFYGRP